MNNFDRFIQAAVSWMSLTISVLSLGFLWPNWDFKIVFWVSKRRLNREKHNHV